MKRLWKRGTALFLAGLITGGQTGNAYGFDRLGDEINGWVWEDLNDDGTYECYYRDMGFLNTMDDEFKQAVHFWTYETKDREIRTTPDGYQVNAALQWVVDGVVQTKTIPEKQEEARKRAAVELYNQTKYNYELQQAPVDKKSSLTAPSPEENAELFSLFRKKYPGSELDKRILYQIRYGYTPAKEGHDTPLASMMSSLSGSKPMANVMNLMAGREVPYPEQWGPKSQFLYDWFVEFLKADDWGNMSERDRAYEAYRYLAEKYAYGSFEEEIPLEEDGAEGACYIAKVMNGSRFACEEFARVYFLMGMALDLEVGQEGLDISRGNPWHVYNVVNIDGTLYTVDASGYSKYGKDQYFSLYEEHFYYEESYKNPHFQDLSHDPQPVENVFADYPGTYIANPQGEMEIIWKGTRPAREYYD